MAEFKQSIKNPTNHLHILNLFIASIAGVISIIGGVYSIRSKFFSPKTGVIKGIVRDENIAKPLYLATVEVSEENGSVVATVKTNEEGRYLHIALREGRYRVKATAPLHENQSKEIKIYSGGSSEVNFDLASLSPAKIVSDQIFSRQLNHEPASLPKPADYIPPRSSMQTYIPVTEAPETYLPKQNTLSRRPFDRSPHLPRRREVPTEEASQTSSDSLGEALTQAANAMIQNWAENQTAESGSEG